MTEDAGSVDSHISVQGQFVVVPDPLGEPGKR